MLRHAIRILFAVIVFFSVEAIAEDCSRILSASHTNVFFQPGANAGPIAYDQIRSEDFEPALREGLRASRARFLAIRENSEPPTFANTIEPLEAVNEPLRLVQYVFENYLGMNAEKNLSELAARINPELAEFSNQILFDGVVAARVQAVFDARFTLGLNTEQMTILENTQKSFLANGANLDPEQKKQVDAIDQRLSQLREKFKEDVGGATNAFQLILTRPDEIDGLPEHAVKAAAAAATAAGHEDAWLITLKSPSYQPFMENAKNRWLRERLWRAYTRRATEGANDNRPVLLEIVKLREQRAHLLGYKNHASYQLDGRMAEEVVNVERFLDRLTEVYKPAASADLKELTALAGHIIQPWDVAFYSARLLEQKFNYKEDDLRPYFPLDQVIQGAFYVAKRLYGVSFIPRPDLPTWDPSVRVFEVRDRNQNELALYYLDPFPRDSKSNGAWNNELRPAGKFASVLRRPHVVNVGNFTPPVDGQPALLSLDEVRTVFHELGHGLHAMLTQVEYSSIAGTNVAWDFVELPSQLNEKWALVPEVLDVYARHYLTGERIPEDLIARVRKAEKFQAGYMGLRQVMMAKLDLAWHAADLSELKTVGDVEMWEQRAVAPYTLVPSSGALTSASFQHIFSGGYAGGYYSYKWADVLACDAFAAFEQNGVFDEATANRLRSNILEKGGSEKPADLYRRFRGCDPDPDALLKSEGLL